MDWVKYHQGIVRISYNIEAGKGRNGESKSEHRKGAELPSHPVREGFGVSH